MEGFYRIDSRIEKQMNDFKEDINRYLEGELSPRAFKALRVPRGFYEQRESRVYMIRIRIAGGGLTADQAREVADVCRDYGNQLHVTTRQNIQIHGVEDEESLTRIVDRLLSVGLTALGGGGNTVRNITSCPFSRYCPNEILPAGGCSAELTNMIVAKEDSFGMPRKYKISFSGCPQDCSFAAYTDLGFVAKKQDNQKGYEVYAGGGMGAQPAKAIKIYDFIPPEDVYSVAEGIKQLFREHGNREDKHTARLRFVRKNVGDEKFRDMCHKAIEKEKRENNLQFSPASLPGNPPEADLSAGTPDSDWADKNLRSEDKEGFYSVTLSLDKGDLSAGTMENLASVAEEFGDGNLYTSQDQLLNLKRVPVGKLEKLQERLEEIEEILIEPQKITRSRTCKGAETCKLGICHSPNLRRAINKKLEEDNLAHNGHRFNIFISGCPNNCGLHGLAHLGFFGAVKRKDERAVPCYRVVAGGDVDHNLARELGVVPAYSVPDLVVDFTRQYVQSPEENFEEFFQNGGEELLADLIGKYEEIPEFTADRNYYYDWGAEEPFDISQLGQEGECGAGVIALIESDLQEARKKLKLHERTDSNHLHDSFLAAARALLVTRGEDATEEKRILKLFEEHFIDSGLVAEEFLSLLEEADEKSIFPEDRKSKIEEFIEKIEELFEKMDSSFKFPGEAKTPADEEETEKSSAVNKKKDLRDVACPMNYVKAKLVLEEMQPGQKLEIFVDEGEPIENVPPSLKEDGHKILQQEKIEDYYRLLVKKKK